MTTAIDVLEAELTSVEAQIEHYREQLIAARRRRAELDASLNILRVADVTTTVEGESVHVDVGHPPR